MGHLPTQAQALGTFFFGIALIHTFLCNWIRAFSFRFPKSSSLRLILHVLGEVEIVFAFWSFILFVLLLFLEPFSDLKTHLASLSFTEPLFVFVIVVVSATKPVLEFAQTIISIFAKLIPLNKNISMYSSCLIVGPLLGSLITEPAAMTVTALLLRDLFFRNENLTNHFKYATIGTLFVNISIGGVLTAFAAPPVIMVAKKWGWNNLFMFTHFGHKAILAVCINTLFVTLFLKNELVKIEMPKANPSKDVPFYLNLIYIGLLGSIVSTAHHPSFFIGFFILFLLINNLVKKHVFSLKIKEAFLVSLFLAGLVVLGSFQNWWLNSFLQKMDEFSLYIYVTFLTAITDNAALTYLGSQLEHIPPQMEYSLVAGAVVGGGLTVIANAPNPAGNAILQDYFGKKGIQASKLFYYAIIPTLVSLFTFRLLPAL